MSGKQVALRFLTIAFLVAWSFTEPCSAQRGRGEGGNRGGGGGRAASGNRGQGGSEMRSSRGSSQSQSATRSRGSQSFQQGGQSRQSVRPEGSSQQTLRQDGGSQRTLPQNSSSQQLMRQRGSSQPSEIRRSLPDSSSYQQRDAGQNRARDQQSFYRGSPDRTIDGRRGSGNITRDTGARDGSDWRSRVFDNRSATDRQRDDGARDRDRSNRENVARDRDSFDRDRDSFSRIATGIRDDWNRRDRNDLPFRSDWWTKNRNDRWPAYGPWGYSRWNDRPYYWWGWTPATNLATWLVFGWNRPGYWGYGPGRNIYYQDDYVYYDGVRYLPVNDYYQQVYDLAHSVPTIDPSAAEKMDWAPLGVFAAIPSGDRGNDSRTLQLAVNKNGVLSGTYYNATNGVVHPVAGMVDDRTQRAAWAYADGEHPEIVFETSIFNLTKSESTMMVHFGPSADETEVWQLVRLERPEALPQPQGQQY